MEKSLITFLLLFNDLKYDKNSLFCANSYSYAIFTVLFYELQVDELWIAFTKEKKNIKLLMTLYCCFIFFYDLKYIY